MSKNCKMKLCKTRSIIGLKKIKKKKKGGKKTPYVGLFFSILGLYLIGYQTISRDRRRHMVVLNVYVIAKLVDLWTDI